jgi:uncharacterized protein
LNPSQKPFRINIGFLINQPIGYSRVLPFELNEIDMGDGLYLCAVDGSIDLIRTQDGLIARTVFDAEVESECSRCLASFQNKIHSEFEEFFTFPYVEPSEDEIRVPEDGNIDFKPILHDYMLIELPIKPVCQPDCRGLCAICGQNLNRAVCEHNQNRETGNIKNDLSQKELREENPTTETLAT